MKILEHRHTGLIVDDLDRMIEFYVGLGLVLKQRDLESGPFIDGLLNTESIVLETAKLILEAEDVPAHKTFCLELMTLNHHRESCAGGKPQRLTEDFEFRTQPRGVLDIAFTVDDIGAVSKYILVHGGDIIGQTMNTTSGHPAFHCYARDPEGNVLHIAENHQARTVPSDGK